MAQKNTLKKILMDLPWIVKLIIAIFADCVYGIVRLIDGVLEKDIVKIIIGILWTFYGLGIGWILDIVWILLGKEPLFF